MYKYFTVGFSYFSVANLARPSLNKKIFKGLILFIRTYNRQSNFRPSKSDQYLSSKGLLYIIIQSYDHFVLFVRVFEIKICLALDIVPQA